LIPFPTRPFPTPQAPLAASAASRDRPLTASQLATSFGTTHSRPPIASSTAGRLAAPIVLVSVNVVTFTGLQQHPQPPLPSQAQQQPQQPQQVLLQGASSSPPPPPPSMVRRPPEAAAAHVHDAQLTSAETSATRSSVTPPANALPLLPASLPPGAAPSEPPSLSPPNSGAVGDIGAKDAGRREAVGAGSETSSENLQQRRAICSDSSSGGGDALSVSALCTGSEGDGAQADAGTCCGNCTRGDRDRDGASQCAAPAATATEMNGGGHESNNASSSRSAGGTAPYAGEPGPNGSAPLADSRLPSSPALLARTPGSPAPLPDISGAEAPMARAGRSAGEKVALMLGKLATGVLVVSWCDVTQRLSRCPRLDFSHKHVSVSCCLCFLDPSQFS